MEGFEFLPIDITITNHAEKIWMSEHRGTDKTDWRPFLDSSFWNAASTAFWIS